MQLDLHCHTHASFDCRMKPEKVIARAKAAGLDAIAITDHDSIDGALEAQEVARRRGDILVVLGEEIDTKAGDLLGLFLREKVETQDPMEAIRAIHDQGGIAVLPHPFAKSLSIEERVARALDGCEGFNARHATIASVDGTMGEPNIVAFAQEYDLTLTSSSDSHFYREIGRARTIVPASSLAEARQALLSGNTALSGRRSHPFNRLSSYGLRFLRRLVHPEPE